MPLANLVAAWELVNPPGRAEFRRALAPSGKYGKWICGLPAAVRLGRILFSHAGILPDWAHDGIDGLNRIVLRDMASHTYFARFPPSSPLVDPEGPLWTRQYAHGAKWVPAALREVLGRLGACSMVIGHTPSRDAKVRARYARRVICIDTGLGREGAGKLSCLLVEKGVFRALYPPKRQVKLGEVPGPVKPPRLPGDATKAL